MDTHISGFATLCSALLAVAGLAAVGCQDAISPEPTGTDRQQLPGNASAQAGQSSSQSRSNAATEGQFRAQVAELRRATAEYHRFERAQADGFVPFSIFVPNMGFHFVNKELITADKTFDWDKNVTFGSAEHRKNPPILLFGERADATKKKLFSVEYMVPHGEDIPKDLFAGTRDDDAWHTLPTVHELIPPARSKFSSLEGICHYVGGLALFLGITSGGDKIVIVPPDGKQFGSATWSTIDQSACPQPGPAGAPLLGVHGKLHTLHAWVWKHNPEGLFHPTNPEVTRSGSLFP